MHGSNNVKIREHRRYRCTRTGLQSHTGVTWWWRWWWY